MPIEGLSSVRRLPRLGKIKMGIKVTNAAGVEHPQKTDHFVVPPEVAKVYGNEPKSLDIIIPVEDEDKWAPQYYKLYSRTQGLVCRGDGCSARRLIDTATGDRAHKDTKASVLKDWECTGRKCPDYIARDACKEVMSLQFILYKVPGMGIWQIDTSSVNSIININSCADYIRGVFGKISWIPLQLTIEPKEVQTPESSKRQTVYVLNLRNQMVLLDMVEATKKFQTQLPANTRLMLPRVDEEAVDANELAADGQEPPDVVKQDIEAAIAPASVPVVVVSPEAKKVSEEELDQIFLNMKSASSRVKVDPLEVGTMINDLRREKVPDVSREGMTNRFLKYYHVSKEDLDKVQNYEQMLNLLSNEHLQDFIVWLTELSNKTR